MGSKLGSQVHMHSCSLWFIICEEWLLSVVKHDALVAMVQCTNVMTRLMMHCTCEMMQWMVQCTWVWCITSWCIWRWCTSYEASWCIRMVDAPMLMHIVWCTSWCICCDSLQNDIAMLGWNGAMDLLVWCNACHCNARIHLYMLYLFAYAFL